MLLDNSFDLSLQESASLRASAAATRIARIKATEDQIYDGMINQILPPRRNPELPRTVSVGGCSIEGCDYMQPERWDLDYLDLYFDLDAQSVLTTAGNAAFAVTMAPVDPYFVPVAIAVTINDATDMDLDRRAFFTAITVDGCRQLDINTAVPTMATTQLIPSDKWDPRARNGCACPIVMAPYTNTGIGSAVAIVAGINRNPVGINVMVTVNFYGKKYSCCPKWLEGVPDKERRPERPGRLPPAAPVPVTSAGGGRSPVFGR